MRALALVVLLAVPARAGLTVDRTRDGIITVGAGVLWFGSELGLKPALAPAKCRLICDVDLNGFDKGVRDALVWDAGDRSTARLFANLLAYGGLPAAMIGATWLVQRDSQLVIDDAILIVEAIAVSSVLNQTVKFIVGRDRPEVKFGGPTDNPHDDHLSFYSGHTNVGFSSAAAATAVLALRNRSWIPVAVGGGALALATGYLRIAADKHYASDVLTGAILGTAVGIGTVWLHKTPDTEQRNVALVAGPTMLGVNGTF